MKILKIKADKMQELVKFGFEEERTVWHYDFGEKVNTLAILKDNRKLFLFDEFSDVPSVIYDLIKADMVEVVEG